MSQYLTRTLPVISAKAGAAIVEGTLVMFTATDVVGPITSPTDVYIGVALNTVDSGSNVTIALRGSGAQCLGKLVDTTTAGAALYASGSGAQPAYFTTTAMTASVTAVGNTSTTGSVVVAPSAYALEAGVAKDLIRIALS